MLKRIIDFIKHGVWQDNSENGGKGPWYARIVKIIIYTVQGLGAHDVSVRAAALTFFTLMSLVPIAALIFAIVKGFGLEEDMMRYLDENFSQFSIVIENLRTFADNMLLRVRGGVVAIVGFAVLLWAVMQVFGNIENALNNIWDIKKQRSVARKFSDYVAVIFVAPVLWIISSSLVSSVRSSIASVSGALVVDVLFGLLSLIVIWLMFAFIYYVLPNTKVRFKGALIAGAIAGTLFQVFQVGYVFLQSFLTSYNFIYGSFAALPLFLIWLQWSWMILLVGAELSFAYQNISKYEQERDSLNMCYDRRRKVMLATMVTIVRHLMKGEGPVNSEIVANELDLPVRIIRDVIFDLETAGLVASVKSDTDDKVNMYIPARDVHSITVFDVIDGVESHSNANLNICFKENDKLNQISLLLDNMKQASKESSFNRNITEIIEPIA